MPCVYETSEERTDVLQQEVNQLSGWLCDLCTAFEIAGSVLSPEIQEWYDEHTACEAEKVKREALSKLTRRERRILGL